MTHRAPAAPPSSGDLPVGFEHLPPIGALTLRGGRDAETAEQLRRFVGEANDGLRKILRAGLYIQHIADRLPYGKLGEWLKTHCPDLPERTAFRWYSLAKNTIKHLNVTECYSSATVAELDGTPLYQLVTRVDADVPQPLRKLKSDLDGLIAGKTATQLLLQFKEPNTPVARGAGPDAASEAMKRANWGDAMRAVAALKRWMAEETDACRAASLEDLVLLEAEARAFAKHCQLAVKAARRAATEATE